MKSFPFDSDIIYDSEGNPSYDRGSDSTDLRDYFHLLFTDGVFQNPSTGLQITSSEQDMSVTVLPGNVNIQGALGIETVERTLVFEASESAYDRIDAVVARLNTNHDFRKIDLYVIKGIAVASPVEPELTRTGGIYELRLANVFIAKNTTTISSERITDTRLNTADCGIVTANPNTIDTTAIYEQYQESLDKYMQYVRDCIDGTTAGRFENLIHALWDNISDEFNETATYAVGDYCIYENALYRCKSAITTIGTWDSGNWERTKNGTEMFLLNKDLIKKQDAATAINTSNIVNQSVNYAKSAGSAVDQTARNNANAALATDITTGITFTNTTVFSAIGAQYVTKVGKMCTLHLCFGITSGINTSSLITQLPNGYRPATSIGNIGTIAFNNGTNYSATFNINQNGIISNVIAVPASTVLLDFSYFTN